MVLELFSHRAAVRLNPRQPQQIGKHTATARAVVCTGGAVPKDPRFGSSKHRRQTKRGGGTGTGGSRRDGGGGVWVGITEGANASSQTRRSPGEFSALSPSRHAIRGSQLRRDDKRPVLLRVHWMQLFAELWVTGAGITEWQRAQGTGHRADSQRNAVTLLDTMASLAPGRGFSWDIIARCHGGVDPLPRFKPAPLGGGGGIRAFHGPVPPAFF